MMMMEMTMMNARMIVKCTKFLGQTLKVKS